MAVRSPMSLLTSVPQAERQAVGRGERVELPSGVTLPAAVMAALRRAPAGTTYEPKLQVLGLLESPAEIVAGAAHRALRMASGAERVLLVSVEEPPAPNAEQGSIFAIGAEEQSAEAATAEAAPADGEPAEGAAAAEAVDPVGEDAEAPDEEGEQDPDQADEQESLEVAAATSEDDRGGNAG
jgi:hypothetical protein